MIISGRNILVGTILLGGFYWWLRPAPKLQVSSVSKPNVESRLSDVHLAKPQVQPASNKDIELRPKVAPSAASEPAPPLATPPNPSNERDPTQSDYTAEQFRGKFRKKDLADWLKEARPYDYSNRQAVVPNLMVAFLIKSLDGEKISYRQATGFAYDSAHLGDCISFRLPDQEVVFGSVRDGSLEVFETGVKWSIIFAINQQHYFLYHRDTTQAGKPGSSSEVIYYYQRKESGEFVFTGEKVGNDGNHASYAPRSRNALDYCQNSY